MRDCQKKRVVNHLSSVTQKSNCTSITIKIKVKTQYLNPTNTALKLVLTQIEHYKIMILQLTDKKNHKLVFKISS